MTTDKKRIAQAIRDRVPCIVDSVWDALNQLDDVGKRTHYDAHADETFQECRVCGNWEDHHDWCPIPAVELLFTVSEALAKERREKEQHDPHHHAKRRT